MSVDASCRRQGVGFKLMAAAEEWCKAQGMQKIQLVTGNPHAAQFYLRKCGYRKLRWGEAVGPWYEKAIA